MSFVLAAFLAQAVPADLSQALFEAAQGTRQPGDTITFKAIKTAEGRLLDYQAMAHRVRIVLFVEPLTMEAGLQRLAWWKTNSHALAETADVLVVSCGSALPEQKLAGLTLLRDPNCLLASRFGSIRPYDGRLGALPFAFVLDDSGIIRRTVEPASAPEQAKALRQAVKRLRRQLALQRQQF
jgi:peroxiredoxin